MRDLENDSSHFTAPAGFFPRCRRPMRGKRTTHWHRSAQNTHRPTDLFGPRVRELRDRPTAPREVSDHHRPRSPEKTFREKVSSASSARCRAQCAVASLRRCFARPWICASTPRSRSTPTFMRRSPRRCRAFSAAPSTPLPTSATCSRAPTSCRSPSSSRPSS